MSLKNRLAENGIKNVFFGSQRKSESDTLYPHGLIVENNIIEGNLKDENEIWKYWLTLKELRFEKVCPSC